MLRKYVPVLMLCWLMTGVASQAREILPQLDGSNAKNMKLVFSDEFEASQLDQNKWATCYWWNQNGCTNLSSKELSWYQPQNATVDGGILSLTAMPKPTVGVKGKLFDYTSGMVTTGIDESQDQRPRHFDFRYGYVEIKARAPNGKGLWPAIWLLPSSRESLPEIDIMELLGDSPTQMRMHYHFKEGSGQKDAGRTATVADLTSGWHVYGLDWQKDHINWYLDGKLVWQYTDASKISDKLMYLIINLAVGGWAGDPDKSTVFPAKFEIDYVRLWQRN